MSDSEAAQPRINVEEYRQFIAQVELLDIWLASSKSENKHGPIMPDESVQVAVADRSSWTNLEYGFRALTRYSVRFKVKNRNVATVEVVFAVDYASSEPMTDGMFVVFERNNLPLNTWPYLREFLSGTVGRMGWVPFILPARKINAGS